MPTYKRNLAFAEFQPPPPDFVKLRAALRHRPEEASRFWLADEGMIPRADFFNPANLARLLRGSASAEAGT